MGVAVVLVLVVWCGVVVVVQGVAVAVVVVVWCGVVVAVVASLCEHLAPAAIVPPVGSARS